MTEMPTLICGGTLGLDADGKRIDPGLSSESRVRKSKAERHGSESHGAELSHKPPFRSSLHPVRRLGHPGSRADRRLPAAAIWRPSPGLRRILPNPARLAPALLTPPLPALCLPRPGALRPAEPTPRPRAGQDTTER